MSAKTPEKYLKENVKIIFEPLICSVIAEKPDDIVNIFF